MDLSKNMNQNGEIMQIALCQKWLESEAGWGCRDDGFSLHQNIEDCKKYIADYWNSMPKETPDEYSRPDGEPYLIKVSDELFNLLKHSSRYYKKAPQLNTEFNDMQPMN